MNVPDLPDARAHLNIRETRDDVELGDMLTAAIAVVERHVGPLSPRTVVEMVRHPGGPVLLLGTAPVLSLTEVVDVPSDGTADIVYNVASFVVDPTAGLATWIGATALPAKWLRVTYTAGRADGDLPGDLRQAVLEQLRHLWETQRGGVTAPRGGAEAGGMGARGFTIPRRVEQLLAPHVRVGPAIA